MMSPAITSIPHYIIIWGDGKRRGGQQGGVRRGVGDHLELLVDFDPVTSTPGLRTWECVCQDSASLYY